MTDVSIEGGSAGAGGITPGVEAAVDRLRASFRVSSTPLDYSDTGGNLLGHYRTNLITGATVSIGANGPLASCRWAGPLPPVAVILAVTATPVVTAAITAATPIDCELIIARSYTVADTGGSTVIPTRMRSAMSVSSFADFRVAGTAALTAGTRTLDPAGSGYAAWQSLAAPTLGATANTAVAVGAADPSTKDLFRANIANGEHPIILGVNEGIVIRSSTAPNTTGSIRWVFTIEHCELVGF